MFWQFFANGNGSFGGNTHQDYSDLDRLLERGASIEELLENEDLLQELRCNHSGLVQILTQEDILKRVFEYALSEFQEYGQTTRSRYGCIALEILSSENPSICHILVQTSYYLEHLWSIFESSMKLESSQANALVRIISSLLSRNPREVLDFVESKKETPGLFLKHLDCPSIVDLIMRLVAVDDIEERRTTLNWLIDQGFLTQLVEQLNSQHDIGFHINASQILVDMISMSNVCSTRILQQLAHEGIIQNLISQCLTGEGPRKTSSLVHNLLVLIALTNRLRNFEQCSELLEVVLRVIATRLKDIVGLLVGISSSPSEELATPGGKVKRFGVDRVKVCEFLELLFCIEHDEFNAKLCQSHVLNILLECMTNYPWNNFLHVNVNNIIDNIIGYPMRGDYHPVVEVSLYHEEVASPRNSKALRLIQLFDGAQFVDFLIKYHVPVGDTSRDKKVGYVGVLRRMANMIAALKDAKPQMFELVKDHFEKPSWKEFIAHDLAEANELERSSLTLDNLKLPPQSMDDDNAMLFNGDTNLGDGHLNENFMNYIQDQILDDESEDIEEANFDYDSHKNAIHRADDLEKPSDLGPNESYDPLPSTYNSFVDRLSMLGRYPYQNFQDSDDDSDDENSVDLQTSMEDIEFDSSYTSLHSASSDPDVSSHTSMTPVTNTDPGPTEDLGRMIKSEIPDMTTTKQEDSSILRTPEEPAASSDS